MAIGQELLNVPFSEMVTSLGQAISQAQLQLDTTSMKIAQIMAGEAYDVPNADGSTGTHEERLLVQFGGEELSMLELGFTPSFYHFVDTIIEVKISITMSNEMSSSLSTFRGSFNSYFALFAAGASCQLGQRLVREQVQLQRRRARASSAPRSSRCHRRRSSSSASRRCSPRGLIDGRPPTWGGTSSTSRRRGARRRGCRTTRSTRAASDAAHGAGTAGARARPAARSRAAVRATTRSARARASRCRSTRPSRGMEDRRRAREEQRARAAAERALERARLQAHRRHAARRSQTPAGAGGDPARGAAAGRRRAGGGRRVRGGRTCTSGRRGRPERWAAQRRVALRPARPRARAEWTPSTTAARAHASSPRRRLERPPERADVDRRQDAPRDRARRRTAVAGGCTDEREIDRCLTRPTRSRRSTTSCSAWPRASPTPRRSWRGPTYGRGRRALRSLYQLPARRVRVEDEPHRGAGSRALAALPLLRPVRPNDKHLLFKPLTSEEASSTLEIAATVKGAFIAVPANNGLPAPSAAHARGPDRSAGADRARHRRQHRR